MSISPRKNTHQVLVGNVKVGGAAPIVVQSMTNTDTANIDATVKQVMELANAGSELVRITVNNEEAAEAVPEIRRQLDANGFSVPLVGDFHFNGHKLLEKYPECAKALGKYRINPGNVGKGAKRDTQFQQMIECAVKYDKPVRIGVNGGSLDQSVLTRLLDENRQKALESALKAIDKNFGKGTLMRLGDKPTQEIEAISTGSLGLDIALGIGGIPKGRIIEVYGPESSGKTTLALQIIAQAQKAGGICAFIDAEHALDVKYAKNLGCDVDNLLVSQPDYGEQALDIVETVGRSGAVDVIVVDSVAALTPKSEIEGDMGDAQVGVQARLMSQALRKLTGMTSKMNCTIIFINQIRMKIGMMGYGSPETTTGGNALKFYCSVRIDVRRIQTLKQGDDSIGNRVKAKVIKNKVAPPFKQAEFDIMFGEGISREGELIDYGVKLDIVDKAGTWFSYKDKKLGQGKEKSKAFLKENLDIAMEIEEGIKNAMGFDLPDLDDVETEDSE